VGERGIGKREEHQCDPDGPVFLAIRKATVKGGHARRGKGAGKKKEGKGGENTGRRLGGFWRGVHRVVSRLSSTDRRGGKKGRGKKKERKGEKKGGWEEGGKKGGGIDFVSKLLSSPASCCAVGTGRGEEKKKKGFNVVRFGKRREKKKGLLGKKKGEKEGRKQFRDVQIYTPFLTRPIPRTR